MSKNIFLYILYIEEYTSWLWAKEDRGNNPREGTHFSQNNREISQW